LNNINLALANYFFLGQPPKHGRFNPKMGVITDVA